MNQADARQVLIDACVADVVGACRNDPDYLENLLRFGHDGFDTCRDPELISWVHEQGLQEGDDRVQEAVEALQS